MASVSSSASACLNKISNKTTIDFQNFLDWARDKIQVSWTTGCVTHSEPLDNFTKINFHGNNTFRSTDTSGKSISIFLENIVNWLNARCGDSDDSVFTFCNYSLGEEFDEYQEETMNPRELIECYLQTK